MPRTDGGLLYESLTDNAVIASARVISAKKRTRQALNKSILVEPWQEQAWEWYDTIPEFRYSCNWVGNLLSKAQLTVLKDGKPTDEEKPDRLRKELYGSPEGQTEMFRLLGIHFTVPGDAYLVAVEEGKKREWYILSGGELEAGPVDRSSGKVQWKVGGEDLEGEVLVIRLWRPHPRRVRKADSPSRAVLPILSQMNVLIQNVSAVGDSRLASAGMLLVPNEFSFAGTPMTRPGTESDEEDQQGIDPTSADGLVEELISIAEEAIRDRASAAALVPIVLQGPAEHLDKVRWINFWSDFQAEVRELETSRIQRLALGMDMPAEVLTGVAEVNHWGAWAVDESAIKMHSEPLLAVIKAALTEGYLRPGLESLGVKVTELERYSFGIDTSLLRMRPNRSKEAIELYNLGKLKAETMLKENGFDPSADLMDDEEHKRWLTAKVAQGQTTPEIVEGALRELGVDIKPAIVAKPRPAVEGRPDPSLIEHPVRDIPDTKDEETALLAVAEVALFHALTRAGNKLKTAAKGATPADVPASQLYQYVPITKGKLDHYLEGSWECLNAVRTFDKEALRGALDNYTRALLLSQKPHDVELLLKHLKLIKGAA